MGHHDREHGSRAHAHHGHRVHRVLEGLRWWGRGLIWQLPDEPYPSSYPSRLRRH